MTNYSRVSSDFRGRAGARLCVAIAACLMMALPAMASPHPLRYAEAHEAVAHRGRARRMVVQAEPDGGAAKSSKRKAKSSKAGASSAAHAAKPLPRSRRHKLRPQDEADNDPPVLHRVAARGRNARRDVPRRSIAARRAEVRPSAEESVVVKKTVTSGDFTRAAEGDADAAGPYDHGQSHPDDDERLPMKKSQTVVAEVSAAPEPVTPVGKATLSENVHAAEAAITGHRRPKPSVLPEDHEGKVAVIDDAMRPMVLPTLYMRHGRLVMPPPLKGTREILVHQNTMADSEGLDRIQNDEDLDRMRELHLLAPLNDSAALYINEELPENRRYARPWAVHFAEDTAGAFYSRFHQPLRLSSAVRTVEYQLRLQMVNGNAAAVDGDGASPHLTGQALDFGKHGMSKTEIAWMRAYLAPLMQAGKVDVEEEFQQSCFHISVYRSYAPILRPKPKAVAKVEVAREDVPARDAEKPEATER